MTMYILIGGNHSSTPMSDAQIARLCNTVIKKLNGENPRIVSVPFMLPREDWEWKFRDRRLPLFEQQFGKKFEAILAYPDTFRDDVKWANVIYIHGGDDVLLAHYLDKFKDLEGLFAEKIVVASSAGADYISKIFWTCDWRAVMNGRGLVEVAVITHFDGEFGKDDPRGPVDWAAAKEELTAATNLPIYTIREGEFEIFEEGKRS